MCLHFSQHLTDEYKLKTQRKWVTVYKAVSYSYDNRIVSAIQEQHVRGGWYQSNRSDKQLKDDELNTQTVNRGIHVFLGEKLAKSIYRNYILLKCRALMSDFVAIEDPNANMYCEEAVFMKIWIPAEEIRKAKQGKNK